jgi:hypothetical protein
MLESGSFKTSIQPRPVAALHLYGEDEFAMTKLVDNVVYHDHDHSGVVPLLDRIRPLPSARHSPSCHWFPRRTLGYCHSRCLLSISETHEELESRDTRVYPGQVFSPKSFRLGSEVLWGLDLEFQIVRSARTKKQTSERCSHD